LKNVPDEFLALRRGAAGDLPLPGNSRWGKVARLATGTQVNSTSRQGTLTFVQTEVIAPAPVPIAIKIGFSLDGETYTPALPLSFGGNVIVDLIETIDMKSGAFRERFTLAPGDVLPICATMACGLSLSVTLDGEDVALFVQVVAAPTMTMDCADIVGPTNTTTTPAGWGEDSTIARYDAVAASTYTLGLSPKRAYLSIANQSASNLFIKLGPGVDTTPGSELATIVLPPGSFSGYEVLRYVGSVSFKFDADDATGYALVTEGRYP
jgi:hypothetical protein